MSKRKINPPKEEIKYVSGLEERLKNSPLIFLSVDNLRRHEHDISHAGYEPSVIEVLGNEVGVVMKRELRGALLDPSADDLDTLTSAGNAYGNFAVTAYGEKARIPAETSFGRFVEDAKMNSLIMNIFRFPTNDLNFDTLNRCGLDRQDVLELANRAYQTYCQTTGSLDLGGGMDCLESVGGGGFDTYSGNSENVDLSSDVCEAGSHYKLNFKIEKLQKEVQKKTPVLSHGYLSFEENAVRIMRGHNPNLTNQTATNLFRMLLNLGGVYREGIALPIK